MKNFIPFILLGSLALCPLAIGIAGAIREKRKERRHEPAATFLDLYDDNAPSDLSFAHSREAEYIANLGDHYWGIGGDNS